MAISSLPSQHARHRRAPMSEINVTPMVDVMLVLLIIFMVTAAKLVSGVPVNLPDSRAKALEEQKEPIQISLDETGKLYLDDKAVPMEELSPRLAAIAASGGEEEPPAIHLRADMKLNYGLVMKVMGELNRAGLNRVAMVTTASGDREK